MTEKGMAPVPPVGVQVTVNPGTGEIGVHAMGIHDPVGVLALLNDGMRAVLAEVVNAQRSAIITAKGHVPRNDSDARAN